MINYKDIEKEFDKIVLDKNGLIQRFGLEKQNRELKTFLKAKINLVIDEMIGELKQIIKDEDCRPGEACGSERLEQFTKEYKEKFNK